MVGCLKLTGPSSVIYICDAGMVVRTVMYEVK
jgi:hypothetical protein